MSSLSGRGVNKERYYAVLTNKKGLMWNVKLKDSLGCSDHEMVEFKILRAKRGAHFKLTTLSFRKADFGLFSDLVGRILDKIMEGREAQESWLIFKDHCLQAQEQYIPKKESQGIECIHAQFADHNNLSESFDLLGQWIENNSKKFSRAKGQVLNFGHNNTIQTYKQCVWKAAQQRRTRKCWSTGS
ncbi:hypothetical protein BTVI_14834 [Pitangus sulphuratus]|nr:hypothetical protein BTVI_14834 [Pitangus sulphuratus]